MVAWRIDPDELTIFLIEEIGGCEIAVLDGWLLVRPDARCRTRRYRIERPAAADKESVFAGIARIAVKDRYWADKRGRPYRKITDRSVSATEGKRRSVMRSTVH